MASVPIQIDGVQWDHAQKKATKVTLTGQASILGLSIGGGPIVAPPEPGEPVFPAHPIVPPGGYPPEGGGGEHPAHPIVLPPDVPPIEPPEVPPGTPPNSVVKSAPAGGWGYYTDSESVAYAAFRPAHAGPK
jgi:hypothetical protein